MDSPDDVAERLYGVPLGDFISERTAAAGAARSAGDRESAVAIGALTKASTAAWVVNHLVRSNPQLVDSLDELGRSLREAQDDLDPLALRALGDQRRKLVAAVAAQAADLADAAGQKVGPSVREEVEQTLQAALADERAAQAVRTGRLVRALEPNGFDAVDLEGAVAGGAAARAGARVGTRRPAAAKARVDEVAEARRRKEEAEYRRALAAAEATAEKAAGELSAAEGRRDAASATRDERRVERDELRRRLEEAEDALDRASSAFRAAAAAVDDAKDERDTADADADRLRRHKP